MKKGISSRENAFLFLKKQTKERMKQSILMGAVRIVSY